MSKKKEKEEDHGESVLPDEDKAIEKAKQELLEEFEKGWVHQDVSDLMANRLRVRFWPRINRK